VALFGPYYFVKGKSMSHNVPLAVEEHVHGDTVWVAVRARGAEWSWLTREEAASLGRDWAERYGASTPAARSVPAGE
jgi:hypothetical protein